MLYKLFKLFPKYNFCLPVRVKTNPFHNLTPKQLIDYFNNNPNPESTNTLIYLGIMMNKYHMKELSFVLQCLENMIKAQIDTNK